MLNAGRVEGAEEALQSHDFCFVWVTLSVGVAGVRDWSYQWRKRGHCHHLVCLTMLLWLQHPSFCVSAYTTFHGSLGSLGVCMREVRGRGRRIKEGKRGRGRERAEEEEGKK